MKIQTLKNTLAVLTVTLAVTAIIAGGQAQAHEGHKIIVGGVLGSTATKAEPSMLSMRTAVVVATGHSVQSLNITDYECKSTLDKHYLSCDVESEIVPVTYDGMDRSYIRYFFSLWVRKAK